jgi:hypothetical protein
VGAQCDLLRLVADALEIGGGLDEGQDQAQVPGGGLAPRDDLPGERVDRALELVDLDLVTHDLVDEQPGAGGQAGNGVADLALYPSAHLREHELRAVEQLVELARRVRLMHARKVSAAT